MASHEYNTGYIYCDPLTMLPWKYRPRKTLEAQLPSLLRFTPALGSLPIRVAKVFDVLSFLIKGDSDEVDRVRGCTKLAMKLEWAHDYSEPGQPRCQITSIIPPLP